MSLDITNLNLVPTIDPRINTDKLSKLIYTIENTAIENNYEVIPITNFNSNNLSVTFNNNQRTGISRRIYLNMKFLLTFKGNSGGAGVTLLQCAGMNKLAGVDTGNAYHDAPRANALENAINTIQITMNSTPITTNLNQYSRALTRFLNNPNIRNVDKSYIPSMLDQYLEYDQGDGYNNSELRGYGDNVQECPRGSYWGCTVLSNSSLGTNDDVSTVELELHEPVLMSPFGYGAYDNQPCFFGIDTVSTTITMGGRGNNAGSGLIASLWSHSNAGLATILSTDVSITSASLHIQRFTTPDTFIIPRKIVYPYSETSYHSTSTGDVLASGSSSNYNLQNIQLSGIPEKMYIWVSERDGDFNFTKTDTYCTINSVDITFDNKPGMLTGAERLQLYQMSVRNGCNMSYEQFSKRCGSVICLRFGEDIALSTLSSAGLNGSYNIKMKLNATNNYSYPIVPQLSALLIYTGTITIADGKLFKNINLLTQNDVLSTKNSTDRVNQPPNMDVLGGFNFSDIGNWFKKAGRSVLNVAKKVAPVLAPQYMPEIEAVDTLAKAVGVGKLRGGKKITNAQMKKILGV